MLDLEEAIEELFAPSSIETRTPKINWAWRPHRAAPVFRRVPLPTPSRSFVMLQPRDWDLPLKKPTSKNERRRKLDAQLRMNRPVYLVVPAVVPPDPRKRSKPPPFDWDFITREANRVCSP